MKNLIPEFDAVVLLAIRAVLDFLYDWFSWTQHWIERVLFNIFWVWTVVQHVHNHDNSTLWVIIDVVFLLCLWTLHKTSDTKRAVELLNSFSYYWCLFWLVVTLVAAMYLLLKHFTLYRLCDQLYWVAVVGYLYITRLPKDGPQGKRRRHAKAKLSELFGRPLTWLEPEPAGV